MIYSQESLPQSIMGISESSSTLFRGFYLIKRLDALTAVFTSRLDGLQKSFNQAKKRGDKQLYVTIGSQIFELQRRIYGVVKEKMVVARQLEETIINDKAKLVGVLEPSIGQEAKTQKKKMDGQVQKLKKVRRIESKMEVKCTKMKKSKAHESDNSKETRLESSSVHHSQQN